MRGHVRKRCTWEFIVDVGPHLATGRRRQKSKSGFATKREAESALHEFIRYIEGGGDPSPERMGLGHYLHRWLEYRRARGIRARTLDGYEATSAERSCRSPSPRARKVSLAGPSRSCAIEGMGSSSIRTRSRAPSSDWQSTLGLIPPPGYTTSDTPWPPSSVDRRRTTVGGVPASCCPLAKERGQRGSRQTAIRQEPPGGSSRKARSVSRRDTTGDQHDRRRVGCGREPLGHGKSVLAGELDVSKTTSGLSAATASTAFTRSAASPITSKPSASSRARADERRPRGRRR